MQNIDPIKPPAVGFDLDGTLFTSFTTDIIKGTETGFKRLEKAGVHQVFIATNQAGPVWRKMTHDSFYPTVQRIAQVLVAATNLILDKTGLEVALFVAAHEGDKTPPPHEEWQAAAAWYEAKLTEELYKQNCRAAHIGVSSDYHWRKPRPGMLLAAARHFKCRPQELIFVGDTPEADEAAAKNAGARFIHINEWVSELALDF